MREDECGEMRMKIPVRFFRSTLNVGTENVTVISKENRTLRSTSPEFLGQLRFGGPRFTSPSWTRRGRDGGLGSFSLVVKLYRSSILLP